jgi:gluconokinase
MILVLMGVTGSGKSTVGEILRRQLGWRFFDGDDFHPPANIEKLRRGVALDDKDREPWLQAIRECIKAMIERRDSAVIACSALKHSYRQILQVNEEVVFVYLKADMDLVRERLKKRAGHFMNPDLLQSQFDTLEEPDDALSVDASLPPAQIVRQIRDQLAL